MPVGAIYQPPIAPGSNGSIDGPILIKGVAKPNSVYATPFWSEPIVAFCPPVGPKIFKEPGPIYISFHLLSKSPSENILSVEGIKFLFDTILLLSINKSLL